MNTATGTQSASDDSELGANRPGQPHLVLVLERARPLSGGARHSLANIDRVTVGRGPSRTACRVMEESHRTLQLVVPDHRMSASHACFDRYEDSWKFVDRQSKNGSRVNGVRTTATVLADGDLVEVGRTLFRYRAALNTPVTTPGDVGYEDLAGLPRAFGTLIPSLGHELDVLARVARSDMAALLLGETGTGKEVLARAVHEQSGRSGAFVAINCGALPPSLVESLLFGHKKGAFSGAAQDETGLVRAAHGGTLFLDEVGDLAPASQAALLRVLQERQVIPLGATRPVDVDLRVLAATHLPLRLLVERGDFRQDLYARLTAYSFALPPLRERLDDLGALVASILGRADGAGEGMLSFSSEAAYALLSHSWPNNIRELEQRLKLGALLARDGRIVTAGLGKDLAHTEARSVDAVPAGLSDKQRVLYDELVAKLTEHRGNVTRAGEAMGKARSHMQRLVRRFRIDVSAFRSGRRED